MTTQLLISLGVLVGVLVLLGWYVRQCATLRADVGSDLSGLANGFKKDIVARAERGQDPDWIRYGEESDRQHEFISERMRNLSTAALATGVGGTMLMLLLHFWLGGGLEADAAPQAPDPPVSGSEPGPQPDPLRDLLRAMGFALLASGFGVGANLVILLRYLRRANTDFDDKRANFMAQLRDTVEANPPVTLTATLTATLGKRLDNVLRASAQNFPDVIADFNESVGELATVADRFHDGTVTMNSAVSSLSDSVSQLESLPANLRDEMTRAQETWAAAAKTAQKEHLDELREVIDRHGAEVQEMFRALDDRQERMQAITSALAASVADLDSFPARLRDELAGATQGWADAAAKVHEKHADELSSAVAAHVQHVRQTLDALGDWRSEMAVLEERWHAQRDEQQKAWEEHRAKEHAVHERMVRTLADGTSDIAGAAQDLPAAFTNKLQEGADRLGRAFGSEANNVVTDLVHTLRQHNSELADSWNQQVAQMLNQMTDLREELGRQSGALDEAWKRHVDKLLGEMTDMVREGLTPTVEGITGIGGNLQSLGEDVRGAVGDFASQGEGFSDSMKNAAATFRESSAQLLRVHEAAEASVEQIRRQHEEMYDGLDKALSELRTVLGKVGTSVTTMSKSRRVRRLYAGWGSDQKTAEEDAE